MAPEAQGDLINVYLEIAKDNAKAAAQFVSDLGEKVEKLANLGLTGVPRDEISKGLRGFPYRGRCFYFRVDEMQFVLLRVLHGAQDVKSQFAN